VAPGLDRYVQHLHELRSGARDVVTWRNAEGLVTFPSFHTTWAILLAWSVRRRRGLNLAMGLLNLAVIASTLTTGLHYFIDVPGGALVAVAAIAIESRIARWCDFKPAAAEARPPGRTVNFRVISDADIDALRAAAPVGQEV
jgi:membrane-associated phospholipid phosphatase